MDRNRKVNAARRRAVAIGLALVAAGELIAGGLYASTGDESNRPVVGGSPAPSPTEHTDQTGQTGQTGLGVYSAITAPAPASTTTSTTSTTSTTLAALVSVRAPATTPSTVPTPTKGNASAPVGSSPSSTAPPTVPTAVSTSVSCETDLSLAASPDQPYNFLCRQGSTPLTWATSDVRVYTQGLSPVQTAAFAAAIAQWEADAHFTVTLATSAAGADVVVTTTTLKSDQPGYTEDGYTTDSYRCAPRCYYNNASVVLSSTASLSQTNWVSTVLHELGHVAGLNHVSQKAEVMYPFLTLSSPVEYAAGDQAGLNILAAERGA